MKITNNYKDLEFDNIPIDDFWNIGDEKEDKVHRIHSYPAKFPAFITTKALQYANKVGVKVDQVADIFCGCGTTAYESTRNGINFWGCDINPVATLIAEVKSRKFDSLKLNKYYFEIVNQFEEQEFIINYKTINERINYWFNKKNISDLYKLKLSIEKTVPANSVYRKFFYCAFSNILKSTSMWLTKSIKPQYDCYKKPVQVMEAFGSQYKFMYNANNNSQLTKKTKIKIENVNFLKKQHTEPFIDMIITSPPYVTSYEYADLHQLSAIWLNYTDDYREFREGSIGSLYHNSDFQNDFEQLSTVGQNIIGQLVQSDKNKAKAAAKYFVDMQNCMKKSCEILNPGGLALFVIGNTEYKGVKIDNAKHLVENMVLCNLKPIEVIRRKISKKILTPYRDSLGKFTNDKQSRKVYSEEFIVIGRKHEN